MVTLAVATFVEGTVALAAAIAAAAVLVLREPRSRALAMPVALVLAAAAVALISAGAIGDQLGRRAALGAVAALVALAGLGALAALFHRRPSWFALAVIAALPFRIPIPTGHDDTASLLLPLYAVIAAGCAAHLWRVLRAPGGGDGTGLREDPRARGLAGAVAAVGVLFRGEGRYSSPL